MLARALNGNPRLQRFKIPFITGIRSGILSRPNRSLAEREIRMGSPVFQLTTILGQLYEDAGLM